MGVNKVILIGRLGKDPESRSTKSGQNRCNFSLATDESYKGKDGERHKHTEWHRIVLWGKQADIAQQYLHKGALVYLEGRIQSREWEKDGQKRTTTEIVASNFRMLGDKPPVPHDGTSAGVEPEAPSPEITDDDIPF